MPLLLVACTVLAGGCGTAAPGTAAPSPSAAPAPQPAAPAWQTLRLSYTGGQVSGDTGRVPVALGTTVTVLITGDTADEVHLHGYDRTAQVPAGGTATLTFTADIPGVFEMELHELGVPLVSLEVS